MDPRGLRQVDPGAEGADRMTTESQAEIARLREVAEAASQGPWTWHEYARKGDDPVPYLTGRGGNEATYAYDTEVIEPNHGGECGCRSACRLELRVRDVDQAHIATFDPPTALALLDRLDAVGQWATTLRDDLAAYSRDKDPECRSIAANLMLVRLRPVLDLVQRPVLPPGTTSGGEDR